MKLIEDVTTRHMLYRKSEMCITSKYDAISPNASDFVSPGLTDVDSLRALMRIWATEPIHASTLLIQHFLSVGGLSEVKA